MGQGRELNSTEFLFGERRRSQVDDGDSFTTL